MKIIDSEGIIYGGPIGLSKFVYINNPKEGVRKETRDKKVKFPKEVRQGRQRKENKRVAQAKRCNPLTPEKEPTIMAGDVFISTEALNLFTDGEIMRLMALDAINEAETRRIQSEND